MTRLGKKAERIAQLLFAERWNISLHKLDEDSTKKNPDFAVFAGSLRIATIEVKALGDTSAEPLLLEGQATMGIEGAIDASDRDDNNVARIAKKIHEAVAQFEGVAGPKGLVLYNEDFADHHDLKDALQDGLVYTDGARISTLAKPRVREQLKIDRVKLDFYVWIQNEPHQAAPVIKTFWWTTDIGKKLWHDHFVSAPETALSGRQARES